MKLKKMKKMFLFLSVITAVLTTKVSAECDYQEYNALRASASYVEAKYQIKQVVIDSDFNERPDIPMEEAKVPEGNYALLNKVTVTIMNIPENVYLTVENITDGEVNTYDSNTIENKTLTYQVPDTEQIREYVIKIYSNKEDCHKDEELHKITLKTPMYNTNYGLSGCENNNAYYCQEFVTEEVPNSSELFQDYVDPNEQKEEGPIVKKKNEWIWYGATLLVVVLGITGAIVWMRKNRSTNF